MVDANTIEKLKTLDVSKKDIDMFRDRMDGKSYKEIASKYGYKSAVTVSKRIKNIQKMIKKIDDEIQSGEISIRRSHSNTGINSTRTSDDGSASLSLTVPNENPFIALNAFSDMAGITNAGGSVFGAGASAVYEGFVREDLPHGQRLEMVMKGGGVLVGGLFSFYRTFKTLNEIAEKNVRSSGTPQAMNEVDNSESI